jgi:undecaprenyl-diphosphatase
MLGIKQLQHQLSGYLQRLLRYDTDICLWMNQLSDWSLIQQCFAIVSRLGDGIFWIALIAGIAVFAQGGLFIALHLAVMAIVSIGIYLVFKRLSRRRRPIHVHLEIRQSVAPLDTYSFPSGHTLQAVSLSVVAISYLPNLTWLLVPFCALIALSRVILGLHYPSDVLAATIIASAIAKGSFAISAALMVAG